MTASLLIPVILAGGRGTRLWPTSRETLPKHLAPLIGDESLLQQTARRVMTLAPARQVVAVDAKDQDFLVRRQLHEIDPALNEHRLLEPHGRNTAAAVAFAALYARLHFDPEAVLWVCPSDHLMRDLAALQAAMAVAMPVAEAGSLVTFGITPTRAETGYGYVRATEPVTKTSRALAASRFVEKPAKAAAEAMLEEGGYFWNSGMFLFQADRILAAFDAHAPDIKAAVEAAFTERSEAPGGGWTVPDDAYAAVPAEPIDKAIMERADKIAVVPCDPGWSDLGSWLALWEQQPRDQQGNIARGDVVLDKAQDCLVRAERRLVACAGVRDLAVIETDDVVLVADRKRPEAIKDLVTTLTKAGRSEATAHAEEQRPWGSFRVLHEAPGFKVKEIVVVPGGRLSLQSHRHRAEHWVVVAGTARITVDDEVLDLSSNQSVHIPLGAKHRMENLGDVPMHLIEVQCGGYLGEDDIVRYDDVYGRT
ncbi:MAG: mannose-1-phosphate guanylyltransferase/mannose-6-phosphate isomerase [Pseudomonadota bacterium]